MSVSVRMRVSERKREKKKTASIYLLVRWSTPSIKHNSTCACALKYITLRRNSSCTCALEHTITQAQQFVHLCAGAHHQSGAAGRAPVRWSTPSNRRSSSCTCAPEHTIKQAQQFVRLCPGAHHQTGAAARAPVRWSTPSIRRSSSCACAL